MNLRNSLKPELLAKLVQNAKEQAKHGDFFFAKWTTSDGYVRESPCLVISDHEDPHDEIIILKCTTDPGRTEFDIPITCLERKSVVRTNKVYTIQRNQLLFPLQGTLNSGEYKDIMTKLKEAQCIK